MNAEAFREITLGEAKSDTQCHQGTAESVQVHELADIAAFQAFVALDLFRELLVERADLPS